MTVVTTLTPVLQFGFAGVCLVLIGVLVWLVKQFLGAVRQMVRVVSANTAAIEKLTGHTMQTEGALKDMRDETLRRGCPLSIRALHPPAMEAG